MHRLEDCITALITIQLKSWYSRACTVEGRRL